MKERNSEKVFRIIKKKLYIFEYSIIFQNNSIEFNTVVNEGNIVILDESIADSSNFTIANNNSEIERNEHCDEENNSSDDYKYTEIFDLLNVSMYHPICEIKYIDDSSYINFKYIELSNFMFWKISKKKHLYFDWSMIISEKSEILYLDKWIYYILNTFNATYIN